MAALSIRLEIVFSRYSRVRSKRLKRQSIQGELARRNRQLAEYRSMRFRIGLNLGDVIIREDGTVYGDGINIAARLESLAEPGGICLSGSMYDQIEGKLLLAFKFIGNQTVKNI